MLKDVKFKCARTNGAANFEDVVQRERTSKTGERGYMNSFDKVIDDLDEVRATMDPTALATAAINYWNDTLRPGDTARVFLKVVD